MAAKPVPGYDPEYLDEHHQRIVEFANDYFDEDEEEREQFIDTLMERRGYARTSGWSLPPEPDPGVQPPSRQRRPATAPRGPQRPSYFKR